MKRKKSTYCHAEILILADILRKRTAFPINGLKQMKCISALTFEMRQGITKNKPLKFDLITYVNRYHIAQPYDTAQI